jgi:glycosyltransferase involved in cell wall biosynthesis
MMDVSVIMPTWNRPQFLPAAVRSVLEQTVAVSELLIADDGSDAPTRELLEGFARLPRVRVLFRSHCGNPAEVRNAAIREASGRYIAFLDSDDLWEPMKQQLQLEALRARPECRWSFTSSRCIDVYDRPIELPGTALRRRRAGSLVDSLATFETRVALPAVLVERTLLTKVGLFDEGMGCYDDYDMYVRLAEASDAATIPEPLVKVRQHGAHFSRDNRFAALSARAKFLARAIRLAHEPAVRSRLRRMHALDIAQLARLAAMAGDADGAASKLLSSLRIGWRMPRWWLNAARAQSHLMGHSFKRMMMRPR